MVKNSTGEKACYPTAIFAQLNQATLRRYDISRFRSSSILSVNDFSQVCILTTRMPSITFESKE